LFEKRLFFCKNIVYFYDKVYLLSGDEKFMGVYQKAGKSLSNRRLSQREIAAAAGVSISTVSRVLNHSDAISPDIRERVLIAASSLGYPLETKKLENIVLFRSPTIISAVAGQFEAGVIAGIEAECHDRGMRLMLINIESDPDTSRFVLDTIKHNNRDGFIFLSQDNRAFLEEAHALSHRIVLINTDDKELAIDTIIPDYATGATGAVRYLIQHGHRNILHVASFLRSTVKQRYTSYRATLEEAGIAYDPALVLLLDGTLQVEVAYERMKVFLAGPHPSFSAVFCVNDATAIGVMRVFQEAGLSIPQDVSVIGFDDIGFVTFTNPPLTTIRIERAELGKLAVRRLLERVEEPDLPPIRIELGCRLIERQSVASIK
jgi:DNA-binding LacI/PurR family transcriptional regulator